MKLFQTCGICNFSFPSANKSHHASVVGSTQNFYTFGLYKFFNSSEAGTVFMFSLQRHFPTQGLSTFLEGSSFGLGFKGTMKSMKSFGNFVTHLGDLI